jgi:ABC-type hemin transport system ATPase subunit
MKKTKSVTNVVNIAAPKRSTLDGEIVKLSAITRELLHAADPATRKAVLLLIAHTSGMKQKHVKRVLEAASQLARKYVP